jgi:phenylpyruvate tautomerase PptA (4-oxalocrotonate tautomerase family)
LAAQHLWFIMRRTAKPAPLASWARLDPGPHNTPLRNFNDRNCFMPIVDIQLVAGGGGQSEHMAAKVAEALALVFGAPAGRVWVRLSFLTSSAYAENGTPEAPSSAPVFVHVLHADLPSPQALAVEAKAISQAVGACVQRHPQRVHVEYAPPGRGRMAFGGDLLV